MHQHADSLSDLICVGTVLRRDHERHGAGSQNAAGFSLVFGHLSPELVQILEDSFGLKRRSTHKIHSL